MNKLKKMREFKGLTQRELSEKSGVGYSTIGMIETGDRKGNDLTFKKLSKALECDVSEIREPNAFGVIDRFLNELVAEGIIKDGEISPENEKIIMDEIKKYINK